MARHRKYKCRCCKEFFTPDRRNRRRQHYCCKPACRSASRKASQRKWVAGKGRLYFRGEDNVKRVRRWRKQNPGYARRKAGRFRETLQDPLTPQAVYQQEVIPDLALQDSCFPQVPLLLGLMAHLAGGAEETLQDSMEALARRYTSLGQRLLDQGFPVHRILGGLCDEHQTTAVPRTATPSAPAIQLDRSAAGAR